MSVPADALLATARSVQHALGSSWLALTPLLDHEGTGPRWVVDLDQSPATVQLSPTTWSREELERLRRRLVPERFTRAEPRPRLFPSQCAAYVICPLLDGAELVGLLELASRSETWDPGPLPEWLSLPALLAAHYRSSQRLIELQGRLEREVPYLRDALRAEGDLRTLTGDSPAMRSVRLAIQQVARTDSTVLVLGETGTGKELVARAIHQFSPRRDRLLVRVNCAALAQGVIASELFGHEAGAFTGAAKRRIGRFELAHGGTLFLDEVAEIGPDVQVMLLRVLQERTIERVGGNDSITVDVRLVAATHQDLARAVAEGRFRADLFYRLNVFPIQVPPLRERRGDLPDLVRHFLHHFNRRMNKQVTQVAPETFRLLTDYPWPGNVRELENLIERAMIVTEGDTLRMDPAWLSTPGPVPTSVAAPSLQEVERRSIEEALRRCRGRIYGPRGAAAVLGVKPTTLYGKMRKLGIARDLPLE